LRYIIITYNTTAPRTPMRFCSNGSTGHIDIYLYMSHPLNVIVIELATSTLNYTCVLTLMYGHGERLMYIVFDDGECTCNLLRTGLCSLRTATVQILILCNHRPVGCRQYTVCVSGRRRSRAPAPAPAYVETAAESTLLTFLFQPTQPVPSLPSIRRRYRSHHYWVRVVIRVFISSRCVVRHASIAIATV
jgi:hypothetical protein